MRYLLVVFLIFSAIPAFDAHSQKVKSSDSYEKAEDLLPGEEVTTPTGQKMKVWSTDGPVKVNRAPEPFEDREKTVIDDANIIVDMDSIHRRDRDGNKGQ
ncbi:MAG: hypothetical protein IT292_09310 [Deltaproteobacteria bacterium]|nr:hypothetical protein [Deltaproteobacteria bacterium]